MKNKLIKAISSFLIMVLVIGSIEIYKADYVSATSIESKVSTSLKKNKYTYSGRAFKPTVTVKYAGKKLPKKNYTVKYPSGRKNIGKYTIIVKLKGKYKKKKLSGIKKISFTIVPQKPRFTAATGTNDVSVCINRYLIEMNKLTGYQIAYRKANASKTTKVKTKDYIKTIDGLKSNTRYAFKVRSYKTVKSKKYYSVWSDEVIVTTRKAKEGKEEKTTEKPKTTETKIYKYLLLSNFIGLIIEIFCTYASMIRITNPLLSDFILKLYLVYNIFWTLLLTFYVFYVSFSDKYIHNKEKYRILVLILFIISTFFIYLLRCDLIIKDNFRIRYTEGPSVNFTYSICGLLIFCIVLMLIINRKNIKSKRFIPIYVFIVTLIIGIIIQKLIPGLLIMTYIETITVSIMYFTIENPDLKLVRQMEYAKNQAEKASKAKSDFLSSMSHEIRTPLNAIIGLSEDNMNYKDEVPNEVYENSKDIVNASNTLLEIVGNILDINKIESNKMDLVEEKYMIRSLVSSDMLIFFVKSVIKIKTLTVGFAPVSDAATVYSAGQPQGGYIVHDGCVEVVYGRNRAFYSSIVDVILHEVLDATRRGLSCT